MSKWKDTSSFSRGDTDRTPKEWRLSLEVNGRLEICIHRHIHHAPDEWLLSCHEIGISQRVLKSKETARAQKEAVAVVESFLAKRLEAVRRHIEDEDQR